MHRERAYAAIRADIVAGVLVESERLSEERLCNDLGMSRAPVRDALRQLTIEGFVIRGTGFSSRVAPIPDNDSV
ncbi:GntR family transcriptional regulator [uncultured Jannaschia sp.]|uniref:GntR family transcriptional regulator n=1 Tax=uncultured Jannaschia sp. TaxID=293347 RepID=UPI0034244A36